MKERYDVVVVGAGPSGLLAAKAVAENGFDVAVLERREKIEVIGRTCGQTLLPPNDYFFGDLFHYNARDKKFCFAKSGLSFSYSGPIKNLYDWYMYSPGMKRMHTGYPEGYTPPVPGMLKAPIAFTYDKEVMTADLLKEARTAGAEIFENCEFTDIVFAGPETIVVAGGKQFRCTYVIAADGTNSRVVQKLGFNNDRRHISNLFVKSYFVSGFKAPIDGDPIVTGVIMYQGKPVYLFAVPRPVGGDWNLLFLTLEQDVDINAAAQYVMKESSFAPYCKAVKIQRELAAMEVIQSPIVKPFKNNVVIVGDAGSCQELECLGAMITGWKGGLAVAAALKEFQLGIAPRAIADYCDWWLNTYIKQYDYQDYLQVFGIAYMFPKPEIIDYIFSILNQTFPPTFNPYTSVKHLGVAMQMAFPKIMAERPDILQELVPNMMAFPSDVLAKTLKKE